MVFYRMAETGLFECFSSEGLVEASTNKDAGVVNCLKASFCPACFYGGLTNKFKPKELQFAQQERCAGTMYYILSPFLCLSSCFCVAPLNVEMRQSFNRVIKNQDKEDCFSACCIGQWCACCSMLQMARELDRARPDGPEATSGARRAPTAQRMSTSRGASCDSEFCSNTSRIKL